MLNQMPLNVIDSIILHTDVLSIPYLKASCKTLSNQITSDFYDSIVAHHIKNKFKDIIHVVNQYHEAITNKDVKEELAKKLLMKLVQIFGRFNDKKVYYALLSRVKLETGFGHQRVFETYKRYIMKQPLEQNDDVIMDSLKKFVVGTDKSVYIVSFNFIDKKTHKKTYYCVINLQFHNTGDIKMDFSVKNQKIIRTFANINIREESVKHAEIFVSDKTLMELSECLVQELGREIWLSKIQVVNNIEKWIGPLTKYEEDIYHDYANSLINPYNYRHEIVKILS